MKHSILSPSSASRWTLCTASAKAEALMPEEEASPAASRGTAIHALLQNIILQYAQQGGHFFEQYARRAFPEMTEEDREIAVSAAYSVTHYCRTNVRGISIKETAGRDSRCRIWTEQEIDFRPFGIEGLEVGTADILIWMPESAKLAVLDLKTGATPVSPVLNKQLTLYAIGAAEQFKLPAEWVELGILQFGQLSRWKISRRLFQEEAGELLEKAREAAEAPVFTPGAEQCKYCKFLQRCQVAYNWATKI